MTKTKETIIEMWNLRNEVTKNAELFEPLSDIGKDIFSKAIAFSFPTRSIIIQEGISGKVEINDVSRFLTLKIQERIPLMSYGWYGKVNAEINKSLCELTGRKEVSE